MERDHCNIHKKFLILCNLPKKVFIDFYQDGTEMKVAIFQFYVTVLNITVSESCQLKGPLRRKYAPGTILYPSFPHQTIKFYPTRLSEK